MIKKYYEFINDANITNDLKYYDESVDFLNNMIEHLKIKNYIIQNDGNILFKGGEISEKYSNLLIIFTNKNNQKTKANFGNSKPGYGFGSYKNYKTIIINNLDELLQPEIGIKFSDFIHEFIHYLDFQRSGYKPKIPKSEKEYYNLPTEFNAHFQEAGTYVSDLLRNENILKNFKEKFKSFDDFYIWMIDNVFDKEFIKNLNSENKKKIQKRIYTIYDEYFN